jgi:cellulose biosynthesis protein BcsQ
MIITVGAIKGGVGSTTLVANLAIERALSGKRVVVVDMDHDQHALTYFMATRIEKERTPVIQVIQVPYGDKLTIDDSLKAKYDDIIIDCPIRRGIDYLGALKLTDKWIVPVCPTPLQYWSLEKLRRIAADANAVRSTLLEATVVGSRVPPTDRQSIDDCLTDLCSRMAGFRRAKALITYQFAYVPAEFDAAGVGELDLDDNASWDTAQREIKRLVAEIYAAERFARHAAAGLLGTEPLAVD